MKTRHSHILLVLSGAFLLVLGRPNFPDDESLFLQARLRPFHLSGAMESFTRRTYDLLSKNSPNENLVYSPFSIHAATSMLFYGSQENSTTFKQLSNLLGLRRSEHYGDYLLNYLLVLMGYERDFPQYVLTANRLYVDNSVVLEPNFERALARFYRAEPEKGDFAHNGPGMAALMNSFVANITKGNINNIIAPKDIDELTRLVIINAIYFKGSWLESFDPKNTRPGVFTLSTSEQVIHPRMMHRVGLYWVSEEDPELDADIIDIPYANQDFSMLVFIPYNRTDYSLAPLEEKLRNYQGSLFDNLYRRMINRKVNLTIPAFEIETSTDISETFITLGVTDVFDQSKSNLFDISTNVKDLHVDYIKHKAQIVVNEEGTEASAATAIVVGTRSSSSIIRLAADRPFIFMIVDKRYNTPLFVGKYVKPSGTETSRTEETPFSRRSDSQPVVSGHNSSSSQNEREQILFPFRGRDTLVLKNEHVVVNE